MSPVISPKALSLGKLSLFFCPLEHELLTFEQADSIRRWLPEDELTKVSRYIQLSDRDKGLMVRGYLRGILSQVANGSIASNSHVHCENQSEDISPWEWRFEYGTKGKPRLIDEQRAKTGIEFNISHSGGWMLVAVIKQAQGEPVLELGVDIERYRQSTNIYPILNNYFTQNESDALLSLPEDKHRDRFFDLWALKESYIKAKGLGLALSLKSFSFDFTKMKAKELAANIEGESAKILNLFEGIGLNLQRGESIKSLDSWSVLFGNLNQDYRFAVSVGPVDSLSVVTHRINLAKLVSSTF
ncbi:4'-phosphopantetheinyl transferase family protein [Shewanella violacea]|uniref:4'-phosphopantetheinyl transferase family protein n=1 Tax=Shewanella violacea (strain JCM 10179 / CIP 106290 / LMG 19151 / DSS12) TaxID=637905 RepID=D4ZHM8_SHEVD|nr:4'-phosphopantetheinyl transferase superfamily protein [Shewanella violacea]BAJ01177.1 4'-phosphopantetheinyl transferase family protein [Shewanella violacea DSS12]